MWVNTWIDITKEEPPQGSRVLIGGVTRPVEVVIFSGICDGDVLHDGGYARFSRVTHWAFLPPPPKEASQNEQKTTNT